MKADIKEEVSKNPNINDTPSTSNNPPRYNNSNYNTSNFNRPNRGYVELQVITIYIYIYI